MNADEYIIFVMMSDYPFDHSVNDEEFKKLSEHDQQIVIEKFDGYGLRNLLKAFKNST